MIFFKLHLVIILLILGRVLCQPNRWWKREFDGRWVMNLEFGYGVISGCLVKICIRWFLHEVILLLSFEFQTWLIKTFSAGSLGYWILFFSPFEVDVFKAILPNSKFPDDKLIWAETQNGSFTIHSACKVAMKLSNSSMVARALRMVILENFGSICGSCQYPIRFGILLGHYKKSVLLWWAKIAAKAQKSAAKGTFDL